MATKHISGSYPAGYYLNSTFQNLIIDPTGVIGGTGITTTAAHPSNIVNLGSVQGTGNGITLSDGGTIRNGSATNTTSLISGVDPVVADNAAATVTNYAGIVTTRVSVAGGPFDFGFDFANGISLNAGGVVKNAASGHIDQGVAVAGGTGTVANLGAISGATHDQGYSEGTLGRDLYRQDYAISLTAGGKVTNGPSAGNGKGTINQGISISGASGTVINDGVITGPRFSNNFQDGQDFSYDFGYSPSIHLANGGTIVNGSASNAAANLANGIVLSGPGMVTNFGIIGKPGGDSGSNGIRTHFDGPAVSFNSPNATLVMEGTGVLQGAANGGGGRLRLGGQAGPGTLTGLGSSITNFASVSVDPGASWNLTGANTIAAGVVLDNSGTTTVAGNVVNSGKILTRANAKLSLGGDVSIALGGPVPAGTFVNAGVVEKSAGTGTSYIRTGSASLIDTGSIVVKSGTLVLSGETVGIAGAITGAGSIKFTRSSATMNANLGPGTSIATAGLTISGSDTHVTVGTNLSYANAFTATGSSELAVKGGFSLSLTGAASFTKVTVDGSGDLLTKGTTALSLVTLGGTANWQNTGVLTATGQLTIGDRNGHKATFTNEVGGVFNITGNAGIGSLLGSSFANAGLLEKTAGAPSTIAVPIVNTGTVEAAHGTLDLQNKVTGTGTLKIDGTGILHADAAVPSSQTVLFNGTDARLVLADATHFLGKLSGFDANDRLYMKQFGAGTTISYAGDASSGKLTVKNGALVATISFLGNYASSGFHVGSDGHGGTLITYSPPAAAPLAASGNSEEKRSFAGVGRDEPAGRLSDFVIGSDDALAARVGLLAQFMSAGFHAAPGGQGGSFVTHAPPADNQAQHIAVPHA